MCLILCGENSSIKLRALLIRAPVPLHAVLAVPRRPLLFICERNQEGGYRQLAGFPQGLPPLQMVALIAPLLEAAAAQKYEELSVPEQQKLDRLPELLKTTIFHLKNPDADPKCDIQNASEAADPQSSDSESESTDSESEYFDTESEYVDTESDMEAEHDMSVDAVPEPSDVDASSSTSKPFDEFKSCSGLEDHNDGRNAVAHAGSRQLTPAKPTVEHAAHRAPPIQHLAQEIQRKCCEYVVLIEVKRPSGRLSFSSGFFFRSDGLLLAARHAFPDDDAKARACAIAIFREGKPLGAATLLNPLSGSCTKGGLDLVVLQCNRDMPLVRTIQISSTRAKKPDSVFFMGSVCQSVSLCQCGCSSQIHSKALHCMHIHSTVIHIYPALICAGTTKGTRFFGHQKSTKHEHVNIQIYSHCAANIHCFMHEHYYTIASLIGTGSSCVDELGFLARFPKGLSGGVFVNLDGHAIATMSYAADEVVAEWVKA